MTRFAMARNRPKGRNLGRRRTDRPVFARIAPSAPFLVQLLTAGARLHIPDNAASVAYGAAGATPRLPPGYRMMRET